MNDLYIGPRGNFGAVTDKCTLCVVLISTIIFEHSITKFTLAVLWFPEEFFQYE